MILNQNQEYDAFISYRHIDRDKFIAERLQSMLESYKVPPQLIKQGAPYKLGRVFRDKEELLAAVSLEDQIKRSLENSKYLIVICSKETPKSSYVEMEIEYFIGLEKGDNIIPVLVDGNWEETLPKPLHEFVLNHTSSANPLTVIDIRLIDGKNTINRRALVKYVDLLSTEVHKIAAQILGCDYRFLVSYGIKTRLIKRSGWLGGISLLFILFGLFCFNLCSVIIENDRQIVEQDEKQRAVLLKAERDKNETLEITKLLLNDITPKLKGIPDATKSIRLKAQSLHISGDIFMLSNSPNQAMQCYSDSLSTYLLALQKNDYDNDARLGLSMVEEKLGDAYLESGDVDEASRWYEDTLKIRSDLEDDLSPSIAVSHLSNIYSRIARICMFKGDEKNAKKYLKQNIEECEDLVDKQNTIDSVELWARGYEKMGDLMVYLADGDGVRDNYINSLNIREQYLKQHDQNKAVRLLSSAYIRAGIAFLNIGDLPLAHL